MKLVIIMSVEQYAEVLERLYAEHRIPVFSETEVQGYRLDENVRTPLNWFGRAHTPIYSKLTFAFVSDEKAAELIDAIDAYNREHDLGSPIRAFQMPVERSV
ncbi:hypothetical protein [Rhodocaloribacter sp.]|jgi:hypothetical protein